MGVKGMGVKGMGNLGADPETRDWLIADVEGIQQKQTKQTKPEGALIGKRSS